MAWIIQKRIRKGDYTYALVPEHPKATKHGYVLEHRVVMENELGRLLRDDEVVHHIDGDKKNNSPANLQVQSTTEHKAHHMRMRYPNGKATRKVRCANCGKIFEREVRALPPIKPSKNVFCSRRCNGIYNGLHSK